MAELSSLELPILEALSDDPSLSQRGLAKRANLSVGRVNYVLRRLMEKGLVKLNNAASSEHKFGYLYLLTPKGVEAKAKLTMAFLHRAALEYQALVEKVDAVLEPALREGVTSSSAGSVAVAVSGAGPLSEVVRQRLLERSDILVVDDASRADLVVVTVADAIVDAGAASQRVLRLA